MKKADSLSKITELWLACPDTHQTLHTFDDFYRSLKQNHPELLSWRTPSTRRKREVKAHLLNQGLIYSPTEASQLKTNSPAHHLMTDIEIVIR